ncbi:GntR family transcriptional regulator [Actinoallomurus iriomotensis]|uniref:GntR family transcriptional regulator n=1 Tax=Actinoallomurus iriomotensis TaxID=478107 RepID=A0A9W6S8I7_9ACTN|nr:GntR family transcriptional regulator [Actinoallomurus iriomotensis]GLY87722.1 GntR family transcriptional regulator [Actinoallomurus iriomotensis]
MGRLGELEPVPRRSTVEIISDELRSAIMYGSLAPGSQLGEADLAARLGVSRGPLREAMQRLVQEGLLRSEPHRGLFVITLAEDDVEDVYLARLAIERAACRMIMARNRGEALVRLTEALQALVTAAGQRDRIAMSDADQAFHQVLVASSGSPRLERMAQTLLVEARMCLNALQEKYPEPDDLVEEHRKLVDAISDGDEERLLRLIEEHMTDSIERLRTPAV